MSTLKVDTITDEAGTGAPTLSQGLTVAGNVSVDGGTIKLDGNYPVGTQNVALGDTALDSVEAGGNYNVAIGHGSLTANTTGDDNSAVGRSSLTSNTTGIQNTAIGKSSAEANTTGDFNTSIGRHSLLSNTTGSSNTALGTQALNSNTTGSNNTAVGYQAGYSNNSWNNSFFGYKAGYANTTGTSLVAIGEGALDANTTASFNIGIGANSLGANTTGASNTAIGDNTLRSNTTASNNTAVGYQAGYANTTGKDSVHIGRTAGLGQTTAVANTFVGTAAGGGVTTGSYNTFIGSGEIGVSGAAGEFVTTGSKNTILGRYNGNQGGLDIRTSSNNIVLSDGDGNPYLYKTSGDKWVITNPASATWGANLQHTGATPYGFYIQYPNASPNNSSSEFIYAADSSTVRFMVNANGNVLNVNNSYGAISDQKLKENIVDAASQWDDIKALTVRKYSMKLDNLDAPNMIGVIAQEVEAAGMGGLVIESPDRDPNTNEDLGTVTKQVNYSILYMKAVKALQEAMDRIETLEAKVTALETP